MDSHSIVGECIGDLALFEKVKRVYWQDSLVRAARNSSMWIIFGPSGRNSFGLCQLEREIH
jgi:hypothetical protein